MEEASAEGDPREEKSPEPTPENFAAAEELLRARPNLAAGRDRGERLRYYAQFHASAGDYFFRLIVRLRPPAHPIEEALLQYHLGKIGRAECDRVFAEPQNRPPVEVAVGLYYWDLDRRVDALTVLMRQTLARFERGPSGAVFWKDGDVEEQLTAVQARSPLLAPELDSSHRVAKEARSEYQLRLAEAGAHVATTAHSLMEQIVRSLVNFLPRGPDGRIPTARLVELYRAFKRGEYPNLYRLRALIHEEQFAVESLRRKRAEAAKPGASEVHITATHCHVKAETARVWTEASDPQPGKAAPGKLKVPRWSEFGIGVHETGVFAFARAPEPGATVKLAEGVSLPLSGDRWDTVFDLACSATDGRTMSRRELLPRLSTKPNPIKSYLKTTLSELRIQLASLLDGPGDIDALLHDDGNTVDLGFTVRAILEAEWDGKRILTYRRPARSR